MANSNPKNRRPKHTTTAFNVRRDSTLEEFLQSQMPGKSRTSIKHLIANKLMCLNSRLVRRIDISVKSGDVVTIGKPEEPQFKMPKGIAVVYEDRHLIVANKDSGLLTMASAKENRRTAYAYLTDYVRFHHPHDQIFIVHRLDRDTSGLLLFAKSEQVQADLQTDWNDTIESRHYVALVEGRPEKDEDTIRTFLREHPKSLKMHVCRPDEGVEAITHYKVVAHGRGYSLVELELETGRKNQIRVHLAHIGHPVAGDVKYGAETTPLGRLCLHAMQIRFRHPVSGETLDFNTGIPSMFKSVIR